MIFPITTGRYAILIVVTLLLAAHTPITRGQALVKAGEATYELWRSFRSAGFVIERSRSATACACLARGGTLRSWLNVRHSGANLIAPADALSLHALRRIESELSLASSRLSGIDTDQLHEVSAGLTLYARHRGIKPPCLARPLIESITRKLLPMLRNVVNDPWHDLHGRPYSLDDINRIGACLEAVSILRVVRNQLELDSGSPAPLLTSCGLPRCDSPAAVLSRSSSLLTGNVLVGAPEGIPLARFLVRQYATPQSLVLYAASHHSERGLHQLQGRPNRIVLLHDVPTTLEQARAIHGDGSVAMHDFDEQDISSIHERMGRLVRAYYEPHGTFTVIDLARRSWWPYSIEERVRRAVRNQRDDDLLIIIGEFHDGCLVLHDGPPIEIDAMEGAGVTAIIGCRTASSVGDVTDLRIRSDRRINYRQAIDAAELILEVLLKQGGTYRDALLELQNSSSSDFMGGVVRKDLRTDVLVAVRWANVLDGIHFT